VADVITVLVAIPMALQLERELRQREADSRARSTAAR
jgi:hypothetical protein